MDCTMEVLQLSDVLQSIFTYSAHSLCEVLSVHIATESGLMTDAYVAIVNFILTKIGEANLQLQLHIGLLLVQVH